MSEHDVPHEGHLTPKPTNNKPQAELVPSAFLSGRWDYLLASADVRGASSSGNEPANGSSNSVNSNIGSNLNSNAVFSSFQGESTSRARAAPADQETRDLLTKQRRRSFVLF
jgi:hypothetical protein